MTALEQALLDRQDDAFPAALDPPSLAAAIGVGQPASEDSAEGSAEGSANGSAEGSNGQQDETKGGLKGAKVQKVKAWEASTPDAAIAAADSLGYDGLVELKRVSHQNDT